MEKWCPIRWPADKQQMPCTREKCAWWDALDKMCCVLSIAVELYRLEAVIAKK